MLGWSGVWSFFGSLCLSYFGLSSVDAKAIPGQRMAWWMVVMDRGIPD
jgi:hypothetical protein